MSGVLEEKNNLKALVSEMYFKDVRFMKVLHNVVELFEQTCQFIHNDELSVVKGNSGDRGIPLSKALLLSCLH